MSDTYVPVPANAALAITTPTDDDVPSASLFGTTDQQLANLAARALVGVQTFTANGTWTKPAHATATMRVVHG